jgi:hypothetical protein
MRHVWVCSGEEMYGGYRSHELCLCLCACVCGYFAVLSSIKLNVSLSSANAMDLVTKSLWLISAQRLKHYLHTRIV